MYFISAFDIKANIQLLQIQKYGLHSILYEIPLSDFRNISQDVTFSHNVMIAKNTIIFPGWLRPCDFRKGGVKYILFMMLFHLYNVNYCKQLMIVSILIWRSCPLMSHQFRGIRR